MERPAVTWWLWMFPVAGVVFGLATYSRRHLFNEGPARPGGLGPRDPLDGRVMWVVLCSCLWPLFTLSGLYAMSRIRSRR